VADPLATRDPSTDCVLDWEATIAYRRHLWSLGLGVAEAMDTAQRGMGLDWRTSLQLIQRSIAAARDFPGALLASGAGTDQLAPRPDLPLDLVITAYEQQFEAIEAAGGRIIMMASRGLAACAKTPDDYHRVYSRLLRQAKQPVILHWLGEMFDPALAGYWGHRDARAAMEVCLAVIAEHAAKVDGIKISLLDKEREIAMRRRLPTGVKMYTGDDCSAFSTRSRRPLRRRCPPWQRAIARAFRPCSSPRFRSHGICSACRRASTRPASSFSPGSTATRTISFSSVGSKAPAASFISPTHSGSRTAPECF
jgi:hypothetical protein